MTPRRPRAESLHERVARSIRAQIDAGVLRHGQVLPSTRDLAKQWDVSVFTINHAMDLLAEEGKVISAPRSKRTVNSPEQESVTKKGITEIPHVIMIGGYAGSGKTELGRILSRETGWPILDKDTLTRPVVEAALETLGKSPHDRESSTYLNIIRPREYEALAAAAMENIQCGLSAVVTAPFIREFNDSAWINRTIAAYSASSVVTTFVWVSCDAETMHMYIRHRGAARDAAKLANWDSYMEGVDVGFRPPTPHFVVDNSAQAAPLQEQARSLLTKIREAK